MNTQNSTYSVERAQGRDPHSVQGRPRRHIRRGRHQAQRARGQGAAQRGGLLQDDDQVAGHGRGPGRNRARPQLQDQVQGGFPPL